MDLHTVLRIGIDSFKTKLLESDTYFGMRTQVQKKGVQIEKRELKQLKMVPFWVVLFFHKNRELRD